ncbi:MAG: hypothetical protein II891_06740 [Bacteroidales bacterium]|nr:hypothetical protein [Bacteroidales bacterium]
MQKHSITPQNVIPANLCIFDSYKVSKKKFQTELNQMKALHPKSEVWERGFAQMKLEWAAHNAAYALGIARSHTKDVDLNFPQSFFVRAFYAVVGVLVWVFVK